MRNTVASLIIVAGLALASTAHAALQISELTGANGTNNAVAASGTTTYTNSIFSCIRGTQLNLTASFKCMAANSSAVTFVFQSSNDSVNWTSEFSWALTANGTAVVTGRTNYTMNAAPFLKLYQVTVAGSGIVTNCLVNAFDKPGF